jgi:DNA-binding Lrp family transcriptional regulator
VVNTHTFDALDAQLLHALQLDGRAPFSRIGEALGVSSQTIARRYARLRSSGALRVVGLTDPYLLGEVVWVTRVHCTPDAATTVAEALARRQDTSWVQLTSGGTDIVCVARVAKHLDGDSLLLQKLPRTPRVLNVTAYCVLHVFLGGAHGLLHKANILTARQERLLRRPAPVTRPLELTGSDRQLLAVLRPDGRAPLTDLSRATGLSQTTVRRRMTELREAGVLTFDVDFDRRLLGLGVQALLWLSVAPVELDRVGRMLAEHSEIAYVAATTGSTNLLASVVCSSVSDLYDYITRRIAVLPAITQMETAPVVRSVKNAVSLNPQR